jgi:di/tricarboxylate transporter
MEITFVILAITIIMFLIGRWPADLVALAALVVLFLAGVLDLEQALSGFASPTVIMIAALFVVGEGLSRTGVTAWLGHKMLAIAGSGRIRLLVVIMTGTALLSAFISNTGTVAILLPAVIVVAWRVGSVPSKLLMPMAFAANTGGLLTLTGTPPNIIINEVLAATGNEPFGYFEYSLIGLPLLFAAIIYMVLVGRRLLPSRRVEDRPEELAESMGELSEEYVLPDNIYQLRVRNGSGLIGKSLEQSRLGRDHNITVLRLKQAARDVTGQQRFGLSRFSVRENIERLQLDYQDQVPGPDTIIGVNDVLLVKGTPDAIQSVMLRFNVAVQPADTEQEQITSELISHEIGLAEVVIAPRSAYRRRTIVQGNFAQKYGVQVLSLRRGDQTPDLTKEKLAVGDALLVRGRWADIELLKNERRNFVVVGSPEEMVRQVVELSPQAVIALLALFGMIALMVTGLVPIVIAALLAAGVMVLGKCITMPQAYRTISWSSVVLIAAMIPMSIALQVTGGAEFVANRMVDTLGDLGPHVLMLGIFLMTTALSLVISNSVTTVLMAPIVIQVGLDMGLSAQPLMMIVAVSASTAFLTPIGTTTNLMVSTPGDYRFSDFLRVGVPLVVIFIILSLLLIPLIWPL